MVNFRGSILFFNSKCKTWLWFEEISRQFYFIHSFFIDGKEKFSK